MCVMTLVRRRGGWPGSVDASRRLPSSRSISWMVVSAACGAAVPVHELVGRGRPPCPRRMVGEVRAVALHGGDHRVDDRPLLLHLAARGEERRVAEQAVQDQPFVGLRQAYAEGAAVEKVHVTVRMVSPWPGTLAPIASETSSSGWTCTRSNAPGASPSASTSNGGAAHARTGSRSSPCAAAAACRCGYRTAYRPSASCRRKLRRDVRLGLGIRATLPRGSRERSHPRCRSRGRIAHGRRKPSASGVCMARRTFTFSFRTDSAVKSMGGSMAVRATSCSRWFWTMSRIAPDCS